MTNPSGGNFYRRYGKRVCDWIASFTALVFLPSLLALLALLVRIKIGAPVLFRQQRPGQHGKPFTLYKFRTMTDARNVRGSGLTGVECTVSLGRFLRNTGPTTS